MKEKNHQPTLYTLNIKKGYFWPIQLNTSETLLAFPPRVRDIRIRNYMIKFIHTSNNTFVKAEIITKKLRGEYVIFKL